MKRPQEVTRGYRGVTEGDKGFLGVSRGYRRLKGDTSKTIAKLTHFSIKTVPSPTMVRYIEAIYIYTDKNHLLVS